MAGLRVLEKGGAVFPSKIKSKQDVWKHKEEDKTDPLWPWQRRLRRGPSCPHADDGTEGHGVRWA